MFSATLQQDANREENQKFSVALSGETDDIFVQLGLQTLEAMDSSRFSLDIREMPEDDARKALARGEISAYVVFPDGFMDEAFQGNLMPIRFVSASGPTTMVSVFKDEVTRMISDVLMESQKGVYGLYDAADGENLGSVGSRSDRLALRYVDYVLVRDRVYALEVLGIADNLPLREYLLCGLSVLFLWLCCLPFAPKLRRPDPALGQLMQSRGRRLWLQLLCDFGAYWLMFLPIAALPVLGAALLPSLLQAPLWQILLTIAGVGLICSAMSFLLYQLTSHLLSGILLQFFVGVVMCFVSGCMYPAFFFPIAVQKLAAWLPAGLMRRAFAGCVTGEFSPTVLLTLIGYSCLFILLSWLARKKGGKGASL